MDCRHTAISAVTTLHSTAHPPVSRMLVCMNSSGTSIVVDDSEKHSVGNGVRSGLASRMDTDTPLLRRLSHRLSTLLPLHPRTRRHQRQLDNQSRDGSVRCKNNRPTARVDTGVDRTTLTGQQPTCHRTPTGPNNAATLYHKESLTSLASRVTMPATTTATIGASHTSLRNRHCDAPANVSKQNTPLNLHQHQSALSRTSLPIKCLQKAVRLPPGEDPSEWIAVHAIDFLSQVQLLYSTLTEFCTASDCSIMSAGTHYQYRWMTGGFDSHRGDAAALSLLRAPSSPISAAGSSASASTATSASHSRTTPPQRTSRAMALPAPDYIDKVLQWAQQMMADPSIFPSQSGSTFSRAFPLVCRTLFKRLFRIYAHIYHAHFNAVLALNEEAHLNTSFVHFILFAREFSLLDDKEQRPLAHVIHILAGIVI